jgi:hypothetical protein
MPVEARNRMSFLILTIEWVSQVVWPAVSAWLRAQPAR